MKRLLLLAVLLAGCGGGQPFVPTAPQPPVAVAIEARDGWTGAPVPVSAPPAFPGSQVSVAAPGYLTRMQLLGTGPVYLWPQDEAFVRQLVYGEAFGGLLTRWDRGFHIAAPGHDDLAAQVAAEVTRTTGLPVTVGGTSGNVVAAVDEADPYWQAQPNAVAYNLLSMRGHTMVSARIIFRSRSAVRLNTFLHEMGHCLGLSHTDGRDVMAPNFQGAVTAFSDREAVALRVMYAHRSAGNAPPDREGAVGSTDTRLRTVVVR